MCLLQDRHRRTGQVSSGTPASAVGNQPLGCRIPPPSAIESTNAEAKIHRLDIGRGFTRVFGTVRNTLLVAFAFAGMNDRMIRDWHAGRRLADP